ncbi:MAG TPA: fluoride efflux transporter CrcB [Gemmatimonadales bacterium]|nr:fluoride efflux transporter CrcB [Gemmatimonadales bacterium]
MSLILAIAFGSAVGGVSRYLLGAWIQRLAGGQLPLHTLLINITGSFLLGFLYRYGADTAAYSAEWCGLLMIGFCGGYTTFSTFSLETIALIQAGSSGKAALYVLSSVILSIGAAAAGMIVGRR